MVEDHTNEGETLALGALGGIGVVVVLTQPAAFAPHASVVVVDASTTPFATAWNETLSRTARGRRPVRT